MSPLDRLVPVAVTGLVAQQGRSFVVLSCADGVCKGAKLNASGARVWRLIDGKRSVAAIARQMLPDGPAPVGGLDRIAQDLFEFLSELQTQGFVVFRRRRAK